MILNIIQNDIKKQWLAECGNTFVALAMIVGNTCYLSVSKRGNSPFKFSKLFFYRHLLEKVQIKEHFYLLGIRCWVGTVRTL